MCEFPIQGVSKCPKISMERYFVFMIILTFLLSTVGLVVAFVWEMNTKLLKFVDAGYHIIAAVLLLIAAIVYIASAEQILDILGAGNKHMPMRRNEKLAAGVSCQLIFIHFKLEIYYNIKLFTKFQILTMLQSLLYGATALLIASKPCSHPY